VASLVPWKERLRITGLEKAFEINLGLQTYDSKFHPTDPIILKPELLLKPCPVCDQFCHKAVDCPELCPLCVKTEDCNRVRAGPQWKDQLDDIITQEDLPDFDDHKCIDHLHFLPIFLNSSMKSIEKEKEKDLEFERAKV
jgi:hypothetical protein